MRFYDYIFYNRSEVGVVTPPGMGLNIKNTPEMNELEPDKNVLKIWAHNFEKQKI